MLDAINTEKTCYNHLQRRTHHCYSLVDLGQSKVVFRFPKSRWGSISPRHLAVPREYFYFVRRNGIKIRTALLLNFVSDIVNVVSRSYIYLVLWLFLYSHHLMVFRQKQNTEQRRFGTHYHPFPPFQYHTFHFTPHCLRWLLYQFRPPLRLLYHPPLISVVTEER